MRQLRTITKSDYQRCFRQWQEHWNKCIQAQGHYFEGDWTNQPLSLFIHSQKNLSWNNMISPRIYITYILLDKINDIQVTIWMYTCSRKLLMLPVFKFRWVLTFILHNNQSTNNPSVINQGTCWVARAFFYAN
jgi:hypothetical protein